MFKLLLLFYFFRRISFSKIKETVSEFIQPSKTFNRSRFWTLISGLTVFEIFLMYMLWNVWYKQNKIGVFHFFDDSKEWMQMDKGGHIITAYSEARYSATLMRWSGLSRMKSALIGFVVGSWYQLTLEFLDGFADKWGFSVSDIAANTTGATFFLAQEKIWQEQRILIKVSNTAVNYPDLSVLSDNGTNETMTLKERVQLLYGNDYTTAIKDYNAINYWLSFNIKSLLPKNAKENLRGENSDTTKMLDNPDIVSKLSKLPDWLNIAIGYGAENMYGGFENKWMKENEKMLNSTFHLNDKDFPRYRQYYISFDVDWNRIKTDNLYHKTLATIFNSIKVPSPTLEISEQGVRWHWLFF